MERQERARAAELFAAALPLAGSERAAFLDRTCTGDPALRADLEELLATEPATNGFLESSVLGTSPLPLVWQARQRELAESLLTDGDRIGDFRVVRFMARGGTSEVYEAQRLDDGTRVALKLFMRAHGSARERERFAQQAQIVAELHHPHLLRILAWGEDQERGLPYLAMGLVTGTSMAEIHAQLAHEGRVPDAAIRRHLVERFAEVAEALAVLHARGLMHRDIKPANIMLAGSDQVPPWQRPAVLVDLGLVRPVALEPAPSTLWLTPSYAAPEVLLNEPVDQRADVFSLGLTMHDVLSGRPADTRLLRRAPRLERLTQLVPDLERDLESIVELATAGAPPWRFAHAGELASDLRSWLAGRPVAARRIRGVLGLWRTIRQRPELALRYGLRGAAAALVILLFLWANHYTIALGTAVRRTRATFAAHALSELPAELAQVPTWAAPLLLPAELMAPAVGEGTQQPLARVLAAIQTDGAEAGLLLAARYLQRDGLAAHPRLSGFLAQTLNRIGSTGDPAGATHIVARLFFERPDVTADDTRASAAVRQELMAVLRRSETLRTRLDCLVALAGCATRQEIPDLIAVLEACVRGSGPDTSEQLRLGFWALAAAMRGCHRTGSAPAEPEEIDRWMVQTRRLVEQLSAAVPQCESRVADPFETFLCALVRACRAAGQRAPAFVGSPFAKRRLIFLETLLEPARTRATILAGGIVRGDPTLTEPPGSRVLDAYVLGRLVGCLGDPELVRTMADRATEWVRLGRGDLAQGLDLFQGGLREEADRARGTDHALDPDPRSLLGAGLGAGPPVLLPLPSMPGAPAEEGLVASWSFAETPCRTGGSAEPPAARQFGIEPDELSLGVSFLLLLAPGDSELRLGFALPAGVPRAVRLEIELQKGVRQLLPYDGECQIDVLLDGEPLFHDLRLQVATSETLRVPLCSTLEARKHVLVLRLGTRSETTLRIHRVTLSLK